MPTQSARPNVRRSELDTYEQAMADCPPWAHRSFVERWGLWIVAFVIATTWFIVLYVVWP